MTYMICSLLLLLAMLGYFRLAKRYGIMDVPNERSSHQEPTIRGGGIIFLLAMVMAGLLQPYYWLPVVGVLIMGLTGFVDDVRSLSGKVRILVHLLCVSILFSALGLFTHLGEYSLILLSVTYVMAIGVINAYNFMDGVNGMTGLYSLVVLAALQYVNLRQVPFVEPDLIWLPLMACVIFLFFNFRNRAVCFAGDVGSISMAYWIIFLLLKLMFQTGNPVYILFLSLYGMDTVLTIGHRVLLGQNIFRAHRLHFYQVLANEKGVPHLWVAFIYAALQASSILIILSAGATPFWLLGTGLLLPLLLIYLVLKPAWMKMDIKS